MLMHKPSLERKGWGRWLWGSLNRTERKVRNVIQLAPWIKILTKALLFGNKALCMLQNPHKYNHFRNKVSKHLKYFGPECDITIVFFFQIGDRYCPMLESQGGDEILYKLLKHRLTNIYMKSLIEEIFETLRSNGYRKY